MKKGFTLLEVLIVVVIAVSVAVFAVPAYKKRRIKTAIWRPKECLWTWATVCARCNRKDMLFRLLPNR